jgi:hypothetical protein
MNILTEKLKFAGKLNVLDSRKKIDGKLANYSF